MNKPTYLDLFYSLGCRFIKNTPVKKFIKHITIFILSYQLIFTNSVSFFLMLFSLFLLNYIVLLRDILFIKRTIKNEIAISQNLIKGHSNKVKTINSYLKFGVFFSTFLMIIIIIYRYPLWISLFQ